jgi:hypothetical protein
MADLKEQGEQGSRPIQLTVHATLQGEAPQRPQIVAYIFNSAGQLLAHGPVGEKGQATLPIPERAGRDSLRVLVGPELERGQTQQMPSYAELQRAGAIEKRLYIDPQKREAALRVEISEVIWACWFPRWCLVRGRVVKRIYTHGQAVDVPICDGKVRIYEVDPLYLILAKVPDPILERIREELLSPLPVIPRPPEPPDPGPVDSLPFERLFRNLDISRVATSAPVTLGSMTHALHGARALAEAAPATTRSALRTLPIDPHFADQLSVANGVQLRNLLLANVQQIKFWLCWWPWWWFWNTTLLAEVDIDDNGAFEAIIFLGCGFFYDQPDLYFTVEQTLGGTPTLVYDPPLPCNVYWDYQCGTEVTLAVTDPRAVACKPEPILPDGGVSILAVGEVSLVDIYGAGATPVIAANKGLVQNEIHTGYTDSPFGATLGLVVDFGPSLRFRTNPTVPEFYYRWSYRQLDGTLNPIGPWTHLNQSVEWHYRFVSGGDVSYPTYKFGPVPKGTETDLFEVPPLVSPDGNPDHYWVPVRKEVDLPSGYFDTKVAPPGTPLPLPIAGKAEVRLEFFDSAGTKLDPAAAGITFRLPRVGEASSHTLTGTIHTDPVGPSNLTTEGDFVFTVHFDNNHTTALIDKPSIPGSVTDLCGFLRYQGGETITINYHAHHDNGFAVYSFQLFKGSPPPYHNEGDEVGLVGDFTVQWGPNGWVPGAAILVSHTPTVEDLLDGCNEAAFGMNLWVWGKATDGWQRIGYDDFYPQAFALAKSS